MTYKQRWSTVVGTYVVVALALLLAALCLEASDDRSPSLTAFGLGFGSVGGAVLMLASFQEIVALRATVERLTQDPVPGNRVPPPDGLVYRRGERVTCEAGHRVCDVVADQGLGAARRSALDNFDPRIAAPASGVGLETSQRCWCGARWLARDARGYVRVHVGDEWR